LPIRKCKVSFVDRHGVYHAVDVQAASVYEAVCRASSIFKHSVVEDPTWAVEFVVEIREQSKSYRVKPDQMKKWLARNGRSPRELMEKKRLGEILNGDLR
jgi:predicted TIM-barrel fold metal-dependent hydrolase